jgi:hypothetical protein
LTPGGRPVAANQPLFILQHAAGDYLGIAVGDVISADQRRVRYRTNTLPGSSGSPCFNDDWELVALHHGSERRENTTYNEGIPLAAILERAEVRKALGM